VLKLPANLALTLLNYHFVVKPPYQLCWVEAVAWLVLSNKFKVRLTEMGYKKSNTLCLVRLIHLKKLSPAQTALCYSLRREAGLCWQALVELHQLHREDGYWLSSTELESLTKGTFALHSQTVQALAQKLAGNVDTITQNIREQKAIGQSVTHHYPYKTPDYQTVVWKESAISLEGDKLELSNGKGRAKLVVDLPAEYHKADICRVELLWRADHYELALTIDTGLANPTPSTTEVYAGCDLGEINLAATVTENGQGLVTSGRKLRAAKQCRNKRHAELTAKLSKCQKGSRRYKRLVKRKCQSSAKLYRQQRDILHKASRQIVNFCEKEGVTRLAVGDVREIADGVDLGKRTNQKLSQWAHGLLVTYLCYKAGAKGIVVSQIAEDYSTKTCSECTQVNSQAPRGRIFVCAGCGAVIHRDGNGGANICSRAKYGQYGKVQIKQIKYLRPLSKPKPKPKLGVELAKSRSSGVDTAHASTNSTGMKLA
jgi:putative transposase